MEFRFCIQDPTYLETTYLYEEIIGAAAGAASWRGVYAFASRDGVDFLIEDPAIEKLIYQGGKVDLLVGIDAVTNRPTLERLQKMEQKYERFRPRVFWNETAGLFHPKLSDFSYSNGCRTVIVGSGNLTPGGLMTNYEGYTVIAAEPDEQIDVSALDEFLERHAGEIGLIDDKALERAARNLIRPIKGGRSAGVAVTGFSRHQSAGMPGRRVAAAAEFDRILIAKVPGAGGRWAQVHFNTEVVQQYFRISDYKTQRVYLRQITPDITRANVEVRPCVYSQSNKNHKIEIGAARGLKYPETPPVLVFRERQLRVFDYMLFLPGENGYELLNDLIQRLPATGRGFPRVITDMDTLQGAWPSCPLFTSLDSDAEEQEI